MTPILTCENLSFSYGANEILNNISFFLNDRECLSILGENGAGKSTLIKCILGLTKPVGGKITHHGYMPTDVGYLPQHKELTRDFPASLFEVVLSGCLNMRGAKPFYSRTERLVAENALETVGMLNMRKKSFCELSGGEKQRGLLARALCSAKKLLILDEPAAGLDPAAQDTLLDIICKLKNEKNMGIIMVSHDTSGALSVSDRVLSLSKNCTDYFFGTKDAYVKQSCLCHTLEGGETHE